MISVKVKRMLVPTDFSDCSQEAMGYAVSLAQAFQATVFLLHVMEPPAYGLDFTLTPPDVAPDVRQRLVERMEQWVDRMKNLGIEVEGHLVGGVPFVEIIKAAKRHEADLIVMGTHGRTGLAHLWLGSTAEQVIQRSHCPVVTVKAARQPSLSLEKEQPIEEARSVTGEVPADKGVTFCHLCGQPSKDIICESCKIRVQAEALERKQRIEKEGRVEVGRR